MVARTSTWTGTPEALDKWEEHVKGQVSGFVSGLPGNAGGAFLIDREAGKALTLTFWETEEAAAENGQVRRPEPSEHDRSDGCRVGRPRRL
jgi:heme-degrading monooxygenase HmoA